MAEPQQTAKKQKELSVRRSNHCQSRDLGCRAEVKLITLDLCCGELPGGPAGTTIFALKWSLLEDIHIRFI